MAKRNYEAGDEDIDPFHGLTEPERRALTREIHGSRAVKPAPTLDPQHTYDSAKADGRLDDAEWLAQHPAARDAAYLVERAKHIFYALVAPEAPAPTKPLASRPVAASTPKPRAPDPVKVARLVAKLPFLTAVRAAEILMIPRPPKLTVGAARSAHARTTVSAETKADAGRRLAAMMQVCLGFKPREIDVFLDAIEVAHELHLRGADIGQAVKRGREFLLDGIGATADKVDYVWFERAVTGWGNTRGGDRPGSPHGKYHAAAFAIADTGFHVESSTIKDEMKRRRREAKERLAQRARATAARRARALGRGAPK